MDYTYSPFHKTLPSFILQNCTDHLGKVLWNGRYVYILLLLLYKICFSFGFPFPAYEKIQNYSFRITFNVTCLSVLVLICSYACKTVNKHCTHLFVNIYYMIGNKVLVDKDTNYLNSTIICPSMCEMQLMLKTKRRNFSKNHRKKTKKIVI